MTVGFLLVTVGLQPGAHGQARGSADRALDASATPDTPPRYVPITAEQRKRDYVRSLVSAIAVAGSAASAGIGQWRDKPEAWGEGGGAYTKRFASSLAGHGLEATVTYGLAGWLHEDNRYIVLGRGTTGGRLKYAVASTFLARAEDGSREMSVSTLAGHAGAAFVSRLWQPPGGRSARGALASMGAGFAMAAGLNVAREFLPRLFRRPRTADARQP